MKVIFVRHSEPDYSMLDKANNPEAYAGFGRDLAPLTEHGRQLAQEAAKNLIFAQAQVLISSSVTRALETATYIARHHDLPLLVEPFFMNGDQIWMISIIQKLSLIWLIQHIWFTTGTFPAIVLFVTKLQKRCVNGF